MNQFQQQLRADLRNTITRLNDHPEIEATIRRTMMREVSALALALIAEGMWEYHEPDLIPLGSKGSGE